MITPWTEEDAAHLMRRTGFGATPAEVDKLFDRGFDDAVEWVLKPPGKGKGDKNFKVSSKTNIVNVPVEKLQVWWLRRMLEAKRPLVEKMTLFWHNHFATAWHKLQDVVILHDQNRRIRKHALGSFRALLKSVSKSPAMILWLDNEQNIKGAPNENFAREVMELFTTGVFDKDGVANYSEADIEAGARAFTGWQLKNGKFHYNPDDHDDGPKTFKGVTANFDGEDILELLAMSESTARRLAWKLFSFFAYPVELDDPILDPLVALYFAHDTAIRPMVKHILRSPEFYSAEARNAHVTSPTEMIVGSMRMLGGKLYKKQDDPDKALEKTVGEWTRDLGQALFDPPSVFGWKEGSAWVSTNYLVQRNRIAARISEGRKSEAPPYWWKPDALLGKKSGWSSMTAAEVVERCRLSLGRPALAPSTVAILELYISTDESGTPVSFELDEDVADLKVRGLVALMLSTPEYQLS